MEQNNGITNSRHTTPLPSEGAGGRLVILGAGESGAGAAVLAKKEGYDVFVSDMSKIADKYKKLLDDHQIAWEEGQHTEERTSAR